MRDVLGTVPTSNSCTKCMGSPGMIHDRTPDCHPKFPEHGCMDDFTTESSVGVQATWVIIVVTFYPWVFLQTCTGRRPVDCCRNQISVLYLSMY